MTPLRLSKSTETVYTESLERKRPAGGEIEYPMEKEEAVERDSIVVGRLTSKRTGRGNGTRFARGGVG